MPQGHSSKAQSYRRKALSCERLIAHAVSPEDRDRLMRIRDSYRALAANQEWLDGLPPTPPAQAAALIPEPRYAMRGPA